MYCKPYKDVWGGLFRMIIEINIIILKQKAR